MRYSQLCKKKYMKKSLKEIVQIVYSGLLNCSITTFWYFLKCDCIIFLILHFLNEASLENYNSECSYSKKPNSDTNIQPTRI